MKKGSGAEADERARVRPKFCFDSGLSEEANAPERVLSALERPSGRDVFTQAYPRCNISAIARLSSANSGAAAPKEMRTTRRDGTSR